MTIIQALNGPDPLSRLRQMWATARAGRSVWKPVEPGAQATITDSRPFQVPRRQV